MKCEIEWCTNEARHYHHIISKCYNGKNSKENLAGLCPNCHDDVHRGNVILEGKFMTTDGYKLMAHRRDEPSITGMEDSRVYLI